MMTILVIMMAMLVMISLLALFVRIVVMLKKDMVMLILFIGEVYHDDEGGVGRW